MFIAAKLEEREPLSSREFAKSTNGRYTAEEIKAIETKICRVDILIYVDSPFQAESPDFKLLGEQVDAPMGFISRIKRSCSRFILFGTNGTVFQAC